MTEIQNKFQSLSIIKRHLEQCVYFKNGHYVTDSKSPLAVKNADWLNGAWYMFQQLHKENPCFCVGDCGVKK